MRKYHYLVLFLIGFLVLWPFMLHKLYIERGMGIWPFGNMQDAESAMAQGAVWGKKSEEGVLEKQAEKEVAEEEAANKEGQPEKEEEQQRNKEQAAEGEMAKQEEAEQQEEMELPPELFFHDTLFIGDSRTMGLSEYSDLENAVIFANSGMSVYRLYSLKNGIKEQEEYLEKILAEKQYRKIYLMLGINELGYDEAHTVKRYEEEVLKLMEAQPEAKIILEANLHVSKMRSERDKLFNNENINKINENIRQIAEKHGLSYIDVNEIFDDENGNLRAEYTHDGVHVLGKYYQRWTDWMMEIGV